MGENEALRKGLNLIERKVVCAGLPRVLDWPAFKTPLANHRNSTIQNSEFKQYFS
jgi:hypothetical protein